MQTVKNFHDTRTRIFQRFNQARQPKPEWQLYSDQEKGRRLREQQEAARQSARVDLERVGRDLRNELQSQRQKFEKGLRPFTFSDLQSERPLGHYYESRAHRFVKETRGDLERARAEYDWAMTNNLIDYGTELLSWLELTTPETSIESRVAIDQLKKLHVDTLKLNDLAETLSALNAALDEHAILTKQLEAGLEKPAGEASDFEEWRQIAEIQGLVKG